MRMPLIFVSPCLPEGCDLHYRGRRSERVVTGKRSSLTEVTASSVRVPAVSLEDSLPITVARVVLRSAFVAAAVVAGEAGHQLLLLGERRAVDLLQEGFGRRGA
jgi:hypothetical protein